jgi:HEAT repeat protein
MAKEEPWYSDRQRQYAAWIEELARDGSVARQFDSADEAVHLLLAALKDDREFVRERISLALAYAAIQTPECLRPALQDEDPRVREGAKAALDEIDRQVGSLIEDLSSSDAKKRAEAARGLGYLRAPAAFGPLMLALWDQDQSVRLAAVVSLAELKDRRAIPELEKLLADEDRGVATAAANALASLGSSAGIDLILDQLQDFDPETRAYAASKLGKLGDSRAVLPLVGALRDADPSVRYSTAKALGNMNDIVAIAHLYDHAADEDPVMREQVNAALEKIREKRGGTLPIIVRKEPGV